MGSLYAWDYLKDYQASPSTSPIPDGVELGHQKYIEDLVAKFVPDFSDNKLRAMYQVLQKNLQRLAPQRMMRP